MKARVNETGQLELYVRGVWRHAECIETDDRYCKDTCPAFEECGSEIRLCRDIILHKEVGE